MTDLAVHIDVEKSMGTFGNGEYLSNVRGVKMWKLATDLDRYAQTIAVTRPEVVLETGTMWGGSALWFADQGCDVVTVDLNDMTSRPARGLTDRAIWVTGASSTDPATVARMTDLVSGRRCMVSLDSDHHAPHVVAEIEAYAPLVSPGCYLVVEDGIFDLVGERGRRGGRDIPEVGGPLAAIKRTLVGDPAWERDEEIERLSQISHSPAGWWRRDG